jgi:hypothetical protein
MYKHIPYRGEVILKVRGKPCPPRPHEKLYDRLFWLILIAAGIGIGCYSFTKPTPDKVGGFLVYWALFILVFFAMRDAKKIKMITPDENDPDDIDDFFEQFEWPYRFSKAQKTKTERGIVSRKHRAKELGHKMSKHSRK